jgi:hypothetical protein
LTRRIFPFGIPEDIGDPSGDARGADTMNRLLLHGARYHDRNSLFVSRELGEMPDWKADRFSIRLALALAEDRRVGPSDRVGLAGPFSVRWPILERAIWGLGASTVPDGHAKLVLRDSDWEPLLERGSALDTPERASWFRAVARDVPPDAVASIEAGVELRHRDWVDRIGEEVARFPPERGGQRVVSIGEPSISRRALVYAGWADGFTTVVLGSDDGGA